MKKQRKQYAPEEKVAILRRHLLEKEPISKSGHPPRSGWLDELGRLKGGWSVGLGVARCAPYWLIQNCPTAPSAASCSRMYVRTCSSSNPSVDTA